MREANLSGNSKKENEYKQSAAKFRAKYESLSLDGLKGVD